MPLAELVLPLLIPAIPGLVNSVIQIIEAVKADADTPEETKAQLDAISADLKLVAARVAAVELPNPPTA